ncbi:hypothetical protein YK48G_04320 [Lentilactobacillus fungorum]|uniref:Uncharacterized protein n=1 Tax=Lentilactobacillus fungorum TaxID=2201250 RepID=A0ABQ3VXR8_9LACO|nr:hypothetical protein YK48G_04320 [Lentilactobacillus fungorum]
MNNDNKKSARQVGLPNATQLRTYLINLHVYRSKKPSIWQRLKGMLNSGY